MKERLFVIASQRSIGKTWCQWPLRIAQVRP
jgi:hypothetical protein